MGGRRGQGGGQGVAGRPSGAWDEGRSEFSPVQVEGRGGCAAWGVGTGRVRRHSRIALRERNAELKSSSARIGKKK